VNKDSLLSGTGKTARKCQIWCKNLSQTNVSTWTLIAQGNNSSNNTCT